MNSPDQPPHDGPHPGGPHHDGPPHVGPPHGGPGWNTGEPSAGGPRPGWEQQRPTGSGGPRGSANDAPGGPDTAAAWDSDDPTPVVLGLPVWTRMDAADAREAWTVLRGWLAEVVFTRYDDLAEAIRPCWYRHPEAVEQLSWLCAAWRQAYLAEEASVSLAGEWHIRWAPSVQTRLKTILKPCSRTHSTNPHDFRASDHRPDDGQLDAFIDADLIARDTHHSTVT